jgi:hypothetical protein
MAKCPVTLEPFTCPVVLPCGHSIERGVYQEMKEKICPVCRNAIRGFYRPPINWNMAELMNIDIPKQSPKARTVAEDCANTANNVLYIRTEKHIDKILREIMRICKNGRKSYTYYFNPREYDQYQIITDRLMNLGFKLQWKLEELPLCGCLCCLCFIYPRYSVEVTWN